LRANAPVSATIEVYFYPAAAATLTEAVHHSSFFVSFAYLNDCFLNDIDETVPSIAISTGMSFPICFKRSFAPAVCLLPATFNL